MSHVYVFRYVICLPYTGDICSSLCHIIFVCLSPSLPNRAVLSVALHATFNLSFQISIFSSCWKRTLQCNNLHSFQPSDCVRLVLKGQSMQDVPPRFLSVPVQTQTRKYPITSAVRWPLEKNNRLH